MSSVLQKAVSPVLSSAVTLVTTAETLVVYSGRCEIQYQTVRALISGWVNVLIGTTATAIVLRLRRGNGITGALIATMTINVTAGNTVECEVRFNEQLLNQEFQDYSLTAQQTAATANGTVNLAEIAVEMING